jgi:hypothetical protein
VRRIALTLAALALVVFPATAAGAPSASYLLAISSGSVDETVRFQGNPTTCAGHGVCGYAGTLHYVFRTTSGSAFATYPERGGPFGFIFGYMGGRGTTTSDVIVDGGTGATPHCTASTSVKADGFGAGWLGRRATVSLHLDSVSVPGTTGAPPTPAFGDTLYTGCPGPSDGDLAASHATPSRRYATSRFRRPRFDLRFAGTRPLRSGLYTGTVRFRVLIRLRREAVA